MGLQGGEADSMIRASVIVTPFSRAQLHSCRMRSRLNVSAVLSAVAVIYSILFTGLSRIGQHLVQSVQRYSSTDVV
jgi:hypothetical protein